MKLGKKVYEETSFQVRVGPIKRTETRQGMGKLNSTTHYGMMVASSLTSNGMHLHP